MLLAQIARIDLCGLSTLSRVIARSLNINRTLALCYRADRADASWLDPAATRFVRGNQITAADAEWLLEGADCLLYLGIARYTGANSTSRAGTVLIHRPTLNTRSYKEPRMSTVTLPALSPIVQIPNGDVGVVYREVADFPGYAVGDDGSVWSNRPNGRSKQTRPWHRLSGSISDGYRYVNLCRGGRTTRTRVNVLILTAFRGPRPAGMQSRHFPDQNRANNALCNLQWATPRQNCADKVVHGTRQVGEKNGRHKITAADVLDIRKRRDAGESFSFIGASIGISKEQTIRIFYRRQWKHIA